MVLKNWESLPDELKNDKTEIYYLYLKKRKISLYIKRLFDIIVSLILLILLSPVLLILSIWIKLDSKGPVFYCQKRVTIYNRTFKIFKFRTMVYNADKIGALVTVGNDTRITKVGAKIRKCRLDELPQLINILLGDMTFVGTRPEVRKYVDHYDEEMMATLLMPAGVTSLASIRYKDEDDVLNDYVTQGMNIDEAYIRYVLPDKMKYNLEYIKLFSFLGDIKLMFQTIFSIMH